jgi:serine protease
VLVAETSSVRVAADESTVAIPLHNGGGGTLVVAAPSVDVNGGGWLGAAVDGTSLRLFVDRDDLPAGFATGTVLLPSNGGDVSITVSAEVPDAAPEDVGVVTVSLRTANSHDIVTTTRADVGDGYRFAFENIPPGDYEIVASTDRDGDGEFCDAGEECGAYPERGAPISIPVFGSDVVRARDFTLSLVVDAF